MKSISVIIPVFNNQSGVQECLQALANQTYALSLIEVIVVDNGSEPPYSITENYPFDVKVFMCRKPGSYAARNVGANAAGGLVLAFIDSDCRPTNQWLEFGMTALDQNAMSTIVGGEVILDRPHNNNAVALYQYITGFGQQENIKYKKFSATANLLCTKQQFEMIGLFNEDLLSGGDREWCWRAIKKGYDIQYVPEVIVHTQPRNSLRSAIRQARRVAAGRKMILNLGMTHAGIKAIEKKRNAWNSVVWIMKNDNIDIKNRLRVVCVAALIYLASLIECALLIIGKKPERR